MADGISHDRYRVRRATTVDEVIAAQRLRQEAFAVSTPDNLDADTFDACCLHFLVEDTELGLPVATFRILPVASGDEVSKSYSAQYYDLTSLRSFAAPMAELGRFCVAAGHSDPRILRLAWGALTAFVDREGIGLVFGCSSFPGTDESAYADAFDLLRERHLAPHHFRPGIKASNVFQFAARPLKAPDRKRALKTMPPLLKSYLTMGGWVSDHAVVDERMNTLHVFTALEIDRVSVARARVLRAIAG